MAKQNVIDKKTQDLTIDPGVSGDSYVQFDINTTGEFRIGVDDTDDSFRVSQGSALGTTDTFVMTDAGERTMPLQPAFLEKEGTIVYSGVSGDGTVYTIVQPTEKFDQGGNFTSPNFTASVAGHYSFQLPDLHIGPVLGGGTNYTINIVTSNRTYFVIVSPTRNRIVDYFGANGHLAYWCSVFADMDAADTAYITFTSSGGAKIDDVERESMSGILVC